MKMHDIKETSEKKKNLKIELVIKGVKEGEACSLGFPRNWIQFWPRRQGKETIK